MENITRLSLVLMMFSLFSITYLVTSVSAQDPASIEPVTDSATPNPQSGITDWFKKGLKSLGISNGPTKQVPDLDSSAAPIGEAGEGGGPAARDMSGKMISDVGHGANSGADAEVKMAACMATKTGSPEARADLCR
jgi:hypothetical protein